MRVKSMGKMGKDFCPNVFQPLPEKFERRSCNDGSRELIPVGRSSPPAMGLTLEHLVGVPSKAAFYYKEPFDMNLPTAPNLFNLLRHSYGSSIMKDVKFSCCTA